MKKLLYITSFAMLFLFGTNSLLMAQQKNNKVLYSLLKRA